MRVPYHVFVLKALCGLVFVMRTDGFLNPRRICTLVNHRSQPGHPLRHGLSLSLKAKKKACAVLVDAENTPYQSLGFILARLNDMGYNPQIMRRAYGDWTKPNLKPYKNIKKNLSFSKINSPTLVSGKGTSDVAMTVGAMDILHRNPNIRCFALVTSDSDFTPLVTRLKQAGKMTVGFGKRQTPKALVKKYKEFVFLDDQKSQKKAPKLMEKKELIEFLSQMILQKSNSSRGWIPLAALGMAFDCREYGYKTVSKYFDANADRFQMHSSRELVRILLPKDRLDHLANLIVSCHDYDNWAPVKTLEEKFNARLYGYDGMENLLDDFPELFRQGIDGKKVLFVRNKVPEKCIQELKRVIVVAGQIRYGGSSVELEYVKENFQMDCRRFGYKTLEDFFRDQSEHFLIKDDGYYEQWVKIRS